MIGEETAGQQGVSAVIERQFGQSRASSARDEKDQAGSVSLTTPWGSSQRWGYADLVEAAEQTVRRSEELDQEYDRAAAM